ncbi:MAG: OmpA family protein [Desulfovibrionaceae bacterium]
MVRLYTLLMACCLLLGACAKTTVVLLPDESGKVGEIVVQAAGDKATLSLEDQHVDANPSGLSKVTILSRATVEKTFSVTLKALPEKAESTLVYFKSESAQPTPESLRQLPLVVEQLKARTAPSVELFGHTDHLGDGAYNQKLSDDRASEVRRLLIKEGVPEAHIRMRGFGARDPLFPPREGKAEPRNRRVEIFVR